jgi:hypothetical protein
MLMFSLAVLAERRLFGRRRLADWHSAWRTEEPRWTGQR